MGRLDGKVALITGSGNGQGRAEANLFAREGAKVAVSDMREADGLRVEAEIKEADGEATFFHLDVTSPEAWEQMVDQIVATYGKLDILVNNAGLSGSSQEDLMGEEGWDLLMKVNAKGPFLGIRCVIPRMLEAGGGSIVNISSTPGIVGSMGARHPAYAASKGGVRLLTKAIAARYAKQNIRCNSVHPGMMPPMTTATDTQSRPRKRRLRQDPHGPLREGGGARQCGPLHGLGRGLIHYGDGANCGRRHDLYLGTATGGDHGPHPIHDQGAAEPRGPAVLGRHRLHQGAGGCRQSPQSHP